jgi:hypothetical protein
VGEANRHVLLRSPGRDRGCCGGLLTALRCVALLLLCASVGCAWKQASHLRGPKGVRSLIGRTGGRGPAPEAKVSLGAWQYQPTTWRPLAPELMGLDPGGELIDEPVSQQGLMESGPTPPVPPRRIESYPQVQPQPPLGIPPTPPARPQHAESSPPAPQQTPVEEIPLPPLHAQEMQDAPQAPPETPAESLPAPAEPAPRSEAGPGPTPSPHDAAAAETAPTAKRPPRPNAPYMVVPPLRSSRPLQPSLLFAPKNSPLTEVRPAE